MKTISIEIPEGKRAEWVNGVLTLVDEQKVEFKFELNDMVKFQRNYRKFSIYRREVVNGEPHYWLKDENGYPYPLCVESYIEPYTEPQDITERIKTFEDACKWCTENGHHNIRREYDCIVTDTLILDEVSPDLIAYLKLRIITCALNEGWRPALESTEQRWLPYIHCTPAGEHVIKVRCNHHGSYDVPVRTVFKSARLAEYAGTQFKDIYISFYKSSKQS